MKNNYEELLELFQSDFFLKSLQLFPYLISHVRLIKCNEMLEIILQGHFSLTGVNLLLIHCYKLPLVAGPTG